MLSLLLISESFEYESFAGSHRKSTKYKVRKCAFQSFEKIEASI